MRTGVYRCFDSNDQLLYVGMSVAPSLRISQHRGRPWGGEIARIEVQHFDSREEARAAEAAAIRSENPKMNVDRSSVEADRHRLALYLPADAREWLDELSRAAAAEGWRLSQSEIVTTLIRRHREGGGG